MQPYQGTTLGLCLALSVLAQPVLAAEGELWETRSRMESSVYGPMDLGTHKECRASGWRDNPDFKGPGGKSECRSQKVERSGNGYVWRFDCGQTKGEGKARMVNADRLEGEMDMQTPEGRYQMRFESRKLGACQLKGGG